MTVSIDIPDDIERVLRQGWADLPRKALEAIAVEAYRTEALTAAEVGRLLGLQGLWEVEEFLKKGRADLAYTEADLAQDLLAIRTARGR